MGADKIPYRNPEGYADPTAHDAIASIVQAEEAADQRCMLLIRSLRQYCPHLRLQFSFSGSAFRDAIYAFLAAAPPFVEFSCSATAASMAARSAVKPRASSSLIT